MRRRNSAMTPYYGGQAITPEVLPPTATGGLHPYRGYGGHHRYLQNYQQGYQGHEWGHGGPLTVDPNAPYSTFLAIRAIASSIRRRGPFAIAELVVAVYVILAGSAFALNMVASRPMRLTNVPLFDPTATGANVAWFVRPVIGTAADMGLDAQVDMFSSDEATVRRDGFGQSRYAVEWEIPD